ncbi:hypothetical protein, partial [Oenococcus oeni]|uniref:hypothetical protein n=1 Tax=Oenococcus oeni TaxID=1247 RepID=UPI001C5BEC4D
RIQNMSYKITFLLNYQIKTATNKGSGCSKKCLLRIFCVPYGTNQLYKNSWFSFAKSFCFQIL